MPSVSVITLASNNGPLLLTAVASILDQTFTDLEIIVTDNVSSDGSIERLLAARPDPRLRILRHATRTSVPESLNLALAECRAPWIAIMDADDIAHPMRLELQLKAAAADPSLDFIATGAEAIDAEGQPLGPCVSLYASEDIRRGAMLGMPIVNPTLLGRAEAFRRLGYRPEFPDGSDYDFVLRALEAGCKFVALSLPLFRYRRHPGSSTLSRVLSHEAVTCAIRLCAARRRAGRPERLAETRQELRERVAAELSLGALYRIYAGECRREGFALLAALHAAHGVRVQPGIASGGRFLSHLLAAMRADRDSTAEVMSGVLKGPFWILLRRAGLAGFPRY